MSQAKLRNMDSPPTRLPGNSSVYSRLHIEGLMTIAPYSDDPENSRRYFAQLRELRNSLQESARVGLPTLSMGMSGDFTVAIEEGATMVRVGTSIFGPRPQKPTT